MDNMQLWLSSSTDSINLNDSAEGFYLNPDLEGLTGLPEIRSVNGLNAGYDGGWTATQLWAARLITIRGVIALNDKAAVETKRKALAKLMAQGKNESLQLKFVSESGNVYTTSVRTTYCAMALKRVFWRQEYQIQLRADDPLIYDDGGAELVAILRVMAGVNGFEIPFEIPFAIGDSADPTDVNVGDEATYPLITLKGDLHSPTIVNLTTNQQMQVLADIITHVEWKAYTTAQTIDGYLQIQDGLQGAPLSLTHLYGNATQKTLSGKNLIQFNDESLTNQSIYYYVNKAPQINTTLVAGQTYTFSADLTVGGSISSTNITLGCGTSNYALDLTSPVVVSGSQRVAITFTPTSAQLQSGTGLFFRFPRTNQADSTGVNYSIKNTMLEKSATATDYEPFCGSIPSPNPDYPQEVKTVSGAQTVKITGKNLLGLTDGTYSNNGITATVSNGVITLTGTATNTSFINIPLLSNIDLQSTWSISLNNTVYGDASTSTRLYRTDGTTYVQTATNTANAKNENRTDKGIFHILQIRTSSGVVAGGATIKPQLELGSQATSYEPYQGQSQEINLDTLELAKIGTYQDYIWNDDGTWKIHKEVGKVLMDGVNHTAGSVNTHSGSHTTANYVNSAIANIPSSNQIYTISDTFRGASITSTWSGSVLYGVSQNTSGNYVQFSLPDGVVSSQAELKTWFENHNTTVYYVMRYPTDTEITDADLIEQLNHIYSLYGGVNNLMLIPSAGAQGEMEVSYATTEDIDYHEVVIDCQARTVTQDGHNLYPALAPGSEFIQLVPGQNRLYLTSTVSSDDGTAEVKFKKGNISI